LLTENRRDSAGGSVSDARGNGNGDLFDETEGVK
jgi:hypothetical protein